jgi:hypothetical protein
MKFITNFILVAVLLFCSIPATALAEIPEQVSRDFAPIKGTIIMPVGDEYLVNLDATSGLREGDILALTGGQQGIIDPATGDALDSPDRPSGFLRVSEIRSGYSYAREIATARSPQKGDPVQRFEQVPTLFSSSLEDKALAQELKSGLPQLNWLEDADKEQPLLFFTIENDTLKVTDSEGTTLQSYNYQDGQLTAPADTLISSSPFQYAPELQKDKKLLDKAVTSVLKTVGLAGGDKRLENPGIVSNRLGESGLWVSPNLDGNPCGLAIADFDQDGVLEIAVALESKIKIFQLLDDQWAQIEQVEFPGGIHLLSLDAYDTNGNGFPELVATANVGSTINSQIVEFRQEIYQRIGTGIPWLLRAVNLPHDDRQLIGQAQGLAVNPFAGDPFIVSSNGNDSYRKGHKIALPKGGTLFSFIPFPGLNEELLYASINTDDHLQVQTPSGTALWESESFYGGSESSFELVSAKNEQLGQNFFTQQRLLRLPSGEILAPQNMGQRIFGQYRNFKKSRVVALEWDGFALQERWRTPEQSGYLADFALADIKGDERQELITVVKYKEKNLLQAGRATLVIYELDK